MTDIDPNVSAAETEKPKPRFARPSAKTVTLADPIQLDGRLFETVTVHKLTIGEFRRHTDNGGRGEVLALPMYADEQGLPIPAEVMDALSMPDAEALTEAAQGFLNKPSPVAAA